MADSDEEYDRKKRDKFRRERSDYSSERRRNEHDRRTTWRDEYYEARRRSRDEEDERDGRRYPPGSPPLPRRDWSPPAAKRFRRDGWESLREYGPGMGMIPPPFGMMDRRPPWMMHGGDMPPHGGPMPHVPSRSMPGEMMIGFNTMGDSRQRGSTFLTFKQFLAQQDDSIDDMEAIRLYHDYKADFRKKQLHQFFNDHKEEDWFHAKYHPNRVEETRKESLANLKKRAEVFELLFNNGKFDNVPLVMIEGDNIVRMMDTAVILMEGGDENDLKTLDSIPEESNLEKKDNVMEEKDNGKDPDSESNKPSFIVDDPTPEQKLLVHQAKQYMQGNGDNKDDEIRGDRKRQRDEYSLEESEEDLSSESKKACDTTSSDIDDEPPPPGMETSIDDNTLTKDQNDSSVSAQAQPETGQTESGNDSKTNTTKEVSVVQSSPAQPRHLHVTKAVYIRHIPPQVSPADILEVCKTIPGYLRMAFADPQPDKGYERRGWVTYSAETNIKDVSARISATKIKDCQLSCQVNRDLTRRVKPASPVTWCRGVVKYDIQQLLKLIHMLDKKSELWVYGKMEKQGLKEEDVEGQENGKEQMDTEKLPLLKCNPILDFPDSLLDDNESSVEPHISEDKVEDGEEGEEEEEGVIKDPATEILSANYPLITTLDRLLWYVRLVHSLDYYNGSLFSDEDNMPHRCGIISTRPKPPDTVTSEEVIDYIKQMDGKINPLLVEKKELTDEEFEKLGKRVEETEVEKFIEVNTEKLGENKYLCPLSGKKFRGPDFVRKHILNKHKEAINEVKSETEYFNNYLKDSDRPVPLDGSAVISGSVSTGVTGEGDGVVGRSEEKVGPPSGGPVGWRGSEQMMMPGFPNMRMGFDPRGRMRGQRRPPRGRGGRGGGRRRLMQYDDLDAPSDMY